LHDQYPDLFPGNIVPNPRDIWNKSDYEKAGEIIDEARKEFNADYKFWRDERDAKMDRLIEKSGSSEKVVSLKKDYHNEALADILLNKRSSEQFVYTGEKFIRKQHPVYKDPTGRWGRAHFYAPAKRLGPLTISTPIFNLIVIWSGVVIMYITLYLDVLRRIIGYFEKFKLKRLHRKLQKLGT
jgi:hypothetical protein